MTTRGDDVSFNASHKIEMARATGQSQSRRTRALSEKGDSLERDEKGRRIRINQLDATVVLGQRMGCSWLCLVMVT